MYHLIPRRLAGLACHKTKQTRALSITARVFSETKDFRPSEELAKERYDIRSGEDLDRKRARLLYQSRKRGMLENGVILSSFADKYLAKLDPKELDQYDRLINLPTNDWDIFYWATKTKPTPAEFETPVMEKLRQHLHSKVSSEKADDDVISRGPSILDNRKPDEIVFPKVKKSFGYDLDIYNTDITNYERELFNDKITNFNPRESMVQMTNWRKKRFVTRIRRTFSSPVSLRHMIDEKKSEVDVYTQVAKEETKSIARENISHKDLIDSNYEKNIKHHNLMQYLLSSDLTDDVEDYDDEAKAWAEIMWHRNYGFSDVNIAPTKQKCKTCQTKLHCCDPGLNGYLPKELLSSLYDPNKSKEINCQRCQFSATYNANLGLDVSEEQFVQVVSRLKDETSSVVCILVDLTDFPGGIYKGLIDLIGVHHKIIIVGNKLDLLPYDKENMIDRVTTSLRNNISKLRLADENLWINDILPISARTGFGVEGLITRILSLCAQPRNVYLLGAANSGKSTLFSALLQSDLCAIRDKDLISRVSKAELACNINMLRFPVNQPEGWEIEMKKRKAERVERDTESRERSLRNTTLFRQATTPHVSLLTDRTEFPPLLDDTSLISADGYNPENQRPSFTDDHPLRNIEDTPPLAATPDNHPHNLFCYQFPSTKTKDQIHDLLTIDEKLEVFPHETIKPRKYTLRPMQTIFIAGLARLDLVTSNSSVMITVFASRYLPVHVIKTKKADQFYCTFIGSTYLGVPFGGEERMKSWPKRLETTKEAEYLIRGSEYQDGLADIVFSSIGWAMVSVCKDRDCIVRAFTPEARGIYCRTPPLVEFGRDLVRGKKIRDTPLFVNPNYGINSIRST